MRGGRHLIDATIRGVAQAWREQGPTPWRYSKAGLVATDLVPLTEAPRPLFEAFEREKSTALVAVMDPCNSRFGRGAMVPARAGLVEKRSQRFTTRLREVPTIRAAGQ